MGRGKHIEEKYMSQLREFGTYLIWKQSDLGKPRHQHSLATAATAHTSKGGTLIKAKAKT